MCDSINWALRGDSQKLRRNRIWICTLYWLRAEREITEYLNSAMILTRPNKNRQKNNNLETPREFYSEIFCWFQAERKSENYLSHANSSVTIIAAAAVEHAKILFEKKKIEINALLMNIDSEMRSHRIRVASCRTTRRSAGHLHGFFFL